MKKILSALLIISMLIIPAACQRTDAPQGDKTVAENGTVAPGWVPGGSEDADEPTEQGSPVENGEENGVENDFIPDSPAPVEIPVVTAAVPDKEVKSISIKTEPKTTVYYAGSPIDTTGLTLNVKFKDGTEKTIAGGFGYSPTVATQGVKKVTVSYGGKTAEFPVTVKSATSGGTPLLSTIRVTQKPKRTVYYLNEKLDTTGMIVTVNYADGSSKDLTEGFKCTPVNLNEKGVQKITVTYGNKSTAFNVTVKEDTVKGIEIKKGPKKVNYYQGDVLDTDGLELTVDYENASSKTVTSGFACSPTLLNEAGLQTITVTYAGKKKTFTVRVKEDTLESLELITGPAKRTYYAGDTLDTKGMTLRATYLSGRAVTLTASDVTCSPTVFTGEGVSIPVAVSYAGKTVHFGVKVIANPIKEIFVAQKPTKQYAVGDTVAKDDIVVKAKYENGTTKTITEFTLHNAKLKNAGSNYVEVTYGDYKTGFTVTAEDVVVQITVKNPDKTTYKVGEVLDKTGMEIHVTYASGKTEIVTSGFTCSPSQMTGKGTQTITVIYKDKSTSFNVTVTE